MPLRPRILAALSWPVVLAAATAHADPTDAVDPTKDECMEADESAQALRSEGKLRDARQRLSLCVAASCPGPVRDDCAERLDELERAQPTVVFDVQGAGGEDLSAVRVKVDGALLTGRLDGTAHAVDAGQHRFTFEADGYVPLEQSLLIREGGKGRSIKAVLGVDPRRTRTPVTRIVSYAALGVGAAGIAVGSVFGVRSMLDKAKLDGACAGNACPSRVQSDIEALHSDGTISSVGFGVGIVGLAAGVVLWIVSSGPKKPTAEKALLASVTPWIGIRAAGVEGSF